MLSRSCDSISLEKVDISHAKNRFGIALRYLVVVRSYTRSYSNSCASSKVRYSKTERTCSTNRYGINIVAAIGRMCADRPRCSDAIPTSCTFSTRKRRKFRFVIDDRVICTGSPERERERVCLVRKHRGTLPFHLPADRRQIALVSNARLDFQMPRVAAAIYKFLVRDRPAPVVPERLFTKPVLVKRGHFTARIS